MLETKINAQGAEVVEDVEFVDDEFYETVIETYVSDQERDDPWPEDFEDLAMPLPLPDVVQDPSVPGPAPFPFSEN